MTVPIGRWILVFGVAASVTGCEAPTVTKEPPPGPDPVQWATVASGYNQTCGTDSANQAYCWGAQISLLPTRVVGDVRFTRLDLGARHVCGSTAQNELYCWGANQWGQVGNGSTDSVAAPVRVAGHQFLSFGTGTHSTCGLDATGQAFCWGDNIYGQLGDGTTRASTVPVAVVGGHRFVQIAVGYATACGLVASGGVYCWGQDVFELHRGHPVPERVSSPVLFQSITMGYNTCGQSVDGHLYCWGLNTEGQLGDGTTTPRLRPQAVVGGHEFQRVAMAGTHACGLTAAGAALCWGSLIGDGTDQKRRVPTAVAGQHTFQYISAGPAQTCAINQNREAYCWGWNRDGQLGDGTSGATGGAMFRYQPVRVVEPAAPAQG